MRYVRVGTLRPGDAVNWAGQDWIILDNRTMSVRMIARDIVRTVPFDMDGETRWGATAIRRWLNVSFRRELMNSIEVDEEDRLQSAKVEDCYGASYDEIALLTEKEYPKYKALIPEVSELWWLIRTTKPERDDRDGRVVWRDGTVSPMDPGMFCGARPVVTLWPGALVLAIGRRERRVMYKLRKRIKLYQQAKKNTHRPSEAEREGDGTC